MFRLVVALGIRAFEFNTRVGFHSRPATENSGITPQKAEMPGADLTICGNAASKTIWRSKDVIPKETLIGSIAHLCWL